MENETEQAMAPPNQSVLSPGPLNLSFFSCHSFIRSPWSGLGLPSRMQFALERRNLAELCTVIFTIQWPSPSSSSRVQADRHA